MAVCHHSSLLWLKQSGSASTSASRKEWRKSTSAGFFLVGGRSLRARACGQLQSRGVETMDNNYRLLDLTVYGRQEPWEDSPAGWSQPWGVFGDQHAYRMNGRPIVQWARIAAGRSDDLSVGA